MLKQRIITACVLGILTIYAVFYVPHYFIALIFGLITWQANMDIATKIQNFFPLKSMYNLIDDPVRRMVMTKFPDKTEIVYDYAVHLYEIAIVLAWTALFVFLSYRLLKKRDL